MIVPGRVLIVDDDEATRYAYERVITAAGYRTKTCRDYFAAAGAIDQEIDRLLIVDLRLPAGTPDGVSVARMARIHRWDLPVIFVTGHRDLAGLTLDGLGPVLLKPVDTDVLMAHVRQHVLPETDQPGPTGPLDQLRVLADEAMAATLDVPAAVSALVRDATRDGVDPRLLIGVLLEGAAYMIREAIPAGKRPDYAMAAVRILRDRLEI
jgi:DNA-binding NtrC family response regulator